MKRTFYRGRFIFIPLAVAAFLTLISFVVMVLWNNLLPAILHVGVITFWQAMGIFVLCKILFGFGKSGKGNWMRGRMEHRFNNMTPEEREKFKQHWESRKCEGFGGPRGRGGRFGDWNDFTTQEAPKATE